LFDEFDEAEYSYEGILQRMLARVSDEVDKREGSVIYDALAPAAVELQLMYIELKDLLKQCFADTADRDYLMLKASERGLEPYSATAAVLKGEFLPAEADVEGKRFNLDSLNFVAGELLEDGTRAVYCESEGTEGNLVTGSLTPLEYIDGLKTARIVGILTAGEDEEDTEDFRQRYLDSLTTQAFGGNVADYKQKVKALNEDESVLAMGGIGQVRVYSADEWNGGGTVRLAVTTRSDTPCTSELIALVQEELDPISGKGLGIAPIGHIVTVSTVSMTGIDISLKLTVDEGYTAEGLKPYITQTIEDYFAKLNATWEDSYTGGDDGLCVVVSYLAGIIQLLTGVRSISDIRVGDKVFGSEYRLGRDELATLGEINVEVV
jgi:uncharacterized phage protein gp47/JayE